MCTTYLYSMHAQCKHPSHWNSHKCKYMSHVHETQYGILPKVVDVLVTCQLKGILTFVEEQIV